MKILKDNQFEDLKAQADSYSSIVTAMVESGEGITAEDITAETIIQALQQVGEPEANEVEDLQPALDAANMRATELEGELAAANSRIVELESQLDETPGEVAATITSKGEPSAEKQDILDYAKKNAGDPFAILAEAEKQGYL